MLKIAFPASTPDFRSSEFSHNSDLTKVSTKKPLVHPRKHTGLNNILQIEMDLLLILQFERTIVPLEP